MDSGQCAWGEDSWAAEERQFPPSVRVSILFQGSGRHWRVPSGVGWGKVVHGSDDAIRFAF